MIDPRINDLGYTARGREQLAAFCELVPADHAQLWPDSDLRHSAARRGAVVSGCGCLTLNPPNGAVIKCGRHRRADLEADNALRLNPCGRRFYVSPGDGWDASSISD